MGDKDGERRKNRDEGKAKQVKTDGKGRSGKEKKTKRKGRGQKKGQARQSLAERSEDKPEKGMTQTGERGYQRRMSKERAMARYKAVMEGKRWA